MLENWGDGLHYLLKGVDTRLTKRYQRLVSEHMNVGTSLSAGLKALPDKVSSFASTQAAWRFYQNSAVSLSKLQEPLTEAACSGVDMNCDAYALCLHDWSRLQYKHANKPDRQTMTHEHDVGYDLQSSLLVSDREGQPLAPVAQRLVSADGSYASYETERDEPTQSGTHLNELSRCIDYLETQNFGKPLVHIIDRESDSALHLRDWHEKDYHWLVRVKGNSSLTYHGSKSNSKHIAATLDFRETREVLHKNKKQKQWIAEAEVQLTRPAKPSCKKGYKPLVPGEPVTARLIVSRIISKQGEVLAEWFLLSNQWEVKAETLACWYYWRWRIESFFKLMKSAGHQLEYWQQESALAIAKRLLVASMACVAVWTIAASEEPEVADLRQLLVKLSGRQVRKKTGFTYPALLDGMWALLAMLQVMQSYSPEELDNIKNVAQRFV